MIMASLKQCSERSGLLWHAASAAGNVGTTNRIECLSYWGTFSFASGMHAGYFLSLGGS